MVRHRTFQLRQGRHRALVLELAADVEAEDRPELSDVPGGGDVRERRLAKFRQNVARFRLYRLRFLQ